MDKKKTPDLLRGSIVPQILAIAIPLACTSILQQLFNSADMAVVGRFAGPEALAAVGANSSLINMMVNIFVGLSVGTNAVVARHLGSGDHQKANEAAHTAILISLISGLILAVIGQVFPMMILRLISTPDDILVLASLYLRIYFAGMPFIMLYNFTSALFRSKGDTRTPLVALLCGGILNVIFNLFFVIVLHMSVAGVGLATVISNIISSLILLYRLFHDDDVLRLQWRKMKLHGEQAKAIAVIGVPAGFQATIFSFSNVLLQSSVNALGTQTIAANAAEVVYEFFLFYVLSAFSQTNVTFVGQNFGAGNLPRCRQGIRRSLALSVSIVSVLCALSITFARPLMTIFTSDPAVIALGLIRFRIVIGTQWINSIIEGLSGALRGLGKSLAPALVCIFGICVFRVFFLFVIYPHNPVYPFLVTIYPLSWILTISMMVLFYFRTLRKIS